MTCPGAQSTLKTWTRIQISGCSRLEEQECLGSRDWVVKINVVGGLGTRPASAYVGHCPRGVPQARGNARIHGMLGCGGA